MRRATLASTLAVIFCCGWPHPATAQVCVRGHPRPQCTGFTVLEFTGAVRLNDKSGPTDQNAAFLYWSAGYLQNIGRTSALGAALKLTADSDGHRYGPVVRYRHWLSASSSIDLAPGLFVGGRDNFVTLEFPSPTADVALNYGDRVGLAVGMDALRQRGGGTHWQGHAGIRFGTWLAPLATLGLGILIGATW
jgi:hypothetical protein